MLVTEAIYKGMPRPFTGPTQWYIFESHIGPPTHDYPFRNLTVGHVRAATPAKALAKARRIALRRRYADRGIRFILVPTERRPEDRGRGKWGRIWSNRRG